jgi:nucleoid-associated protein YgaU
MPTTPRSYPSRPSQRIGRSWRVVAVIALTAGCWALSMAPLWAADDANGGATGEVAGPTKADAASRLRSRVEELESKLDAADAQKGALQLQLELLNRKQADLKAEVAELPPLRQALGRAQSAAERAEEEAAQLRQKIEQLKQQRQATAQKHTAQLTAAELRLREHKDRMGAVEVRIQHLERQLAQREAQVERLRQAEERRAQSAAELEARLREVRARLPAAEGGSLTADDARGQAREDAEVLERLISEGQGIRNPQLWRRVQEVENALHRSQFLLARAEDARTVYRVRPGDSLARISTLFYGDDAGWTRIFEANRHILEDPDRVLPGLTLVIP